MNEREAIIEVPRLTFIKWRTSGSIAYISPIPSPFNYGRVPHTISGDGEELDAVVLGRRLPRGAHVCLPERGRVLFVDAGMADPKLILSAEPLSARERIHLHLFFLVYARLKQLANCLRARRGPTRFAGIEVSP
jgi:inorganic pyrophosphatase